MGEQRSIWGNDNKRSFPRTQEPTKVILFQRENIRGNDRKWFSPSPPSSTSKCFPQLKNAAYRPWFRGKEGRNCCVFEESENKGDIGSSSFAGREIERNLRGKVVGVDGASLVFPVQQQCLMQQKIPIRNPMVMAVPRIPAAAVPFVMVMSSFHAPGGMVTLMLEKLTAVPCTRSGSTIFMQVPSCISVHPFWQSSQELPWYPANMRWTFSLDTSGLWIVWFAGKGDYQFWRQFSPTRLTNLDGVPEATYVMISCGTREGLQSMNRSLSRIKTFSIVLRVVPWKQSQWPLESKQSPFLEQGRFAFGPSAGAGQLVGT